MDSPTKNFFMGNQNLFLLMLSALVVGIAVFAGKNRLAAEASEADRSAIQQAATTVAVRAQAWYRRPAALGGGGRSFAKLTLESIDFDAGSLPGRLAIRIREANHLRIIGTIRNDTTWRLIVDVYPESIEVTALSREWWSAENRLSGN
jgi:hypothetical protein